jgi:hypothetical protein
VKEGTNVDVEQKDTLTTVEDLFVLFNCCIDSYEWVHEGERAELAAALRGSFGLLIRPEYAEIWEGICHE